ncbi:hypothetical protein CEXT_136161 [Caerostris extrusa]|uniref:Uncharacterized protein n=1 Tax=Caerostris extrusa TaxID=172846 RepID=A0AAV4SQ04_CAEEX|nr:hypothetical protein CEXT_136161 [Caerostris extrusa]
MKQEVLTLYGSGLQTPGVWGEGVRKVIHEMKNIKYLRSNAFHQMTVFLPSHHLNAQSAVRLMSLRGNNRKIMFRESRDALWSMLCRDSATILTYLNSSVVLWDVINKNVYGKQEQNPQKSYDTDC